ncbi:MAG: pirin family protein [Desulfatiglandales bacterium]
MITVRKSQERGHLNHGWLDTCHTFSFASYYNPDHMGFRKLRVINEDRVQPNKGFDTHHHENMEIISYVINGALEHKDSMGNGSVIRKGEIQHTSAGTGITHSEYNRSATEIVHFLQIWILPDENGLTPSYEQKEYSERLIPNQLCLIVSRNGSNDSVVIHQDAKLYTCLLEKGNQVEYSIPDKRHVWLQIVTGNLSVNGNDLFSGDGCAISDERQLTIVSIAESEFLLFDLD